MSDLCRYSLEGSVASITIDDGKVNALSSTMTAELIELMSRAENDQATVMITGSRTTFSAGFDLRCDQALWPEMMISGATLARRMLAFPYPVLVACNGNAVAMGALLLNAADIRLGVSGNFRIGLNEVSLGMTLPWFAVALARHRLGPSDFDRCVVAGEILSPEQAVKAGFLDALVEPESLQQAAASRALELSSLDMKAHHETKLRVRRDVISGLDDGIARLESGDDW